MLFASVVKNTLPQPPACLFSRWSMILSRGFIFFKACIMNIPSPFEQASLKLFYSSLFIWLRLTGFLCAFWHRFFPAVKTWGSTLQKTSYTHLYPQPCVEQHMQRFGIENPHYIICMFFLLPQEASDCVTSSLPCFTPIVLTWLHRHICQTPSGGWNS